MRDNGGGMFQTISNGVNSTRDRHKTLAYGVSAADMGMVVYPTVGGGFSFQKSNPMSEFYFRH